MPYEINSALERLEQNLKDLDSAKKQVEATVKTSDKLQQAVSGYVKSLVSIQKGLRQWEKELQGIKIGNDAAFNKAIEQMGTSCFSVVDLFRSQIDETKDGFENDTNAFLIRLERENGKLSEQVNALKILGSSFDNAIQDANSVKTLLGNLSNDLKESLKSQDEVLDVIKEDVGKISNTTSSTVKGYVDEQTRKIEALHSGKDTKLQNLASTISSVKQICDDIKEKSSSIENCCQNIKSNTDSLLREALASKELYPTILQKIENSISSNATKVEEVHQTIKTSVEDIVHQSNINRWIIIIGIIILAAIQFIATK